MNFFKRLAIVIAIIILILWLLRENQEAPPRPNPIAQATATPSPAGIMPMAPPGMATPAVTPFIGGPTPIPPTPAPPVARPAAPAVTGDCDKVQQAARQVGVVVARCSADNGWTVAIVQARERNLLGDFLDACTRLGMRDMDVNTRHYQVTRDRSGRETHQDTYRLRF
ncbi:MAG: hypothetical protein K1X53_10490 [Candidatus Sumerlaeaceae bacterium]|nr:hypothetical protein [Candidatus Sumerlaeaceae bacterium]